MEIITSQKVKTSFPRSPQNFFVLDKEKAKELKPNDCPSALFDLALACCADEPEDRPTFRDVIVSLNQIRADLQLPTPSTPRRVSRSKSQKSANVLSPNFSDPTLPISSSGESHSTSKNILLRCSFTEMNELALRFENEIEVEETLMRLFDPSSFGTSSW